MPAHQSLDEGRKMAGAKGQLRSHRGVVEGGIVNSSGHSVLTRSPMSAAVGGQPEPAIKVVSYAATDAVRIRLDATTRREQSSGKQAVHIGGWIEEGVSVVELPLGSRLLLRYRSPNEAEDNYRWQPRNCNPTIRIPRAR